MAPYAEQMGDWYHQPRPIDMRYVDQPLPDAPAPDAPQISQRVWMRADGTLPDDDPTLHACIVTYASDMTLLDTTLLPHRIRWTGKGIQMASLDHAMWFHRPFRADEWLLYAQDTTSTSSSRGLARGLIYDAAGNVVVSVMQEGLIRVAR
jgi:acyl-CoA thioesterase-2